MAAKSNGYACQIEELETAMGKLIHAVGSHHFLMRALLTALSDQFPDLKARMLDELLIMGAYDRDLHASIQEAMNIIQLMSNRDDP